MKNSGDIDIDVGNRDQLLALIDHVPAKICTQDGDRRHGSGIYVTDIPYDFVNETAAIDYQSAETRGYFKLDILNVSLYSEITNTDELESLMVPPKWESLGSRAFVEQLTHLGQHYDLLQELPPITSIVELAMALAIIRPAKRHLAGKPWEIVKKTIWQTTPGQYAFKKAHAIAYAHLVVVNMNMVSRNFANHYDPFSL